MTSPPIRDAVADWQAFEAEQIPTKGLHLPHLFHDTLERLLHSKKKSKDEGPLEVVELGCGCGELCNWLLTKGSRNLHHPVHVTGTDINEEAIQVAKKKCHSKNGTFLIADVTNVNATATSTTTTTTTIIQQQQLQQNESLPSASFDFAILQLLLSIVGGPKERQATLESAVSLLKPGNGTLYLSCSGVSGDINPNYRRLYDQDRDATGEDGSYFSRDSKTGRILYMTHHFTTSELDGLLRGAGLEQIRIEQIQEASSRRPDQVAYFLYATAVRGG